MKTLTYIYLIQYVDYLITLLQAPLYGNFILNRVRVAILWRIFVKKRTAIQYLL